MKRVVSIILSIIILAGSVLCVDLTAMANQINIDNRAEWLSQLVKTFDMTVESENYPDNYFSDLSEDSPYYKDILVATEFGLVDIEAGDPVNPEGEVTREFAAHSLNYCLKYVLDKDDDFKYSFSDYEKCEYPDDDQIAVDHGWFALDENNNFCPDKIATLDEAKIMIDDAEETLKADEVKENYDSNFEYQDGVVEVDKTSSFEFIDDNTIILYDTSYNIKKGTSFVVYVNEVPVTYVAKNVVKNSDNLKIECEEPENQEDIIKDIDMQEVSQISTENFIPGKGFEVVEEPQSRSARFKSDKFSVKVKTSLPLPAGNTVKVGIKLDNIVLSTKINTKDNSFVTKLDFDFSLEFDGEFDAIGAVHEALDNIGEIGEIPIAGIGYFKFAPEFKITGSTSLTETYSATIGCSYDDKGLHNLTKFNKKEFEYEIKGGIKLGLKAEGGIKIVIAKVGIYASVGVKVEESASTNTDRKTGKDVYCASLDLYLYFDLGLEVKLDFIAYKINNDFNYVIYNKNNSPVRDNFHIENGKKVSKCTVGSPNEQKYITKNSKYGTVTETDGTDFVKVSDFTLHLFSDKTAMITGYTGSASYLDIPNYIGGYEIVAINDSAFKDCSSLKNVTIPNSVRAIWDYAFENCSSLTSVTIPDSVTLIGDSTFSDCSSLTSVTIPDSVTDIGDSAFSGCSNLKNATIGKSVTSIGVQTFYGCKSLTSVTILHGVASIGRLAFKDCSSLTSVIIPNSETYFPDHAFIGASAFEGCSSLTNVTIPNSVTSIGYDAFKGCSKLTNIAIPNRTTKINDSTFEGCSSLTSVTIPNSVTNIGRSAFKDCTSLTSVTIPNGATSIGSSAFENCSSLTNVTIPNSVTSIGSSAFKGCSSLTNVTIPNRVTNIDSYTFKDCTSLTSVTIPNGVTSIGSLAFEGCSSLTSVTIPNGVTSIGGWAFKGCSSLTSVAIPNGVTSIGSLAFEGCSSLTSVTIPKSVTNIGDSAFSHCSSLKNVTIPNSVANIATHVFFGCSSLTNIIIPNSVTNIGDSAFSGCSSLTNVTIPESVTNIGNAAFSGCSSLTNVTIPDSVISIGNRAFAGCSSLTNITISNGVTNIGDSAFSHCSSLKNVTIPKSVTNIGDSAFSDCSSLTSLIIPNGVTSIGYGTFAQCSSITNITIPNSVTSIGCFAFGYCSSLTNITIPNSVTNIGDGAFSGCYILKNISIPKGVTSIGDKAFSLCYDLNINVPNTVTSIGENAFEYCKSVHYNGTKEQWKSIAGNSSEHFFIICTDGILVNGIRIYSLGGFEYELFEDCTAVVSKKFYGPDIEKGTNIKIAESIEYNGYTFNTIRIGPSAFDEFEKMTTIKIPKSVKSIGDYAFDKCTGLKTVYYDGTQEEWNKIQIGCNNECLTNANIHYKHVNSNEHDWIDWKYNNDAEYNSKTDYTDGTATRTCSECGKSETKTIAGTGLLRANSASVVLDASVTLNIGIDKSRTSPFKSSFIRVEFGGESYDLIEPSAKTTTDRTYYDFDKISPEKFADEVTITPYGVTSDGIECKGHPVTYSIKNYCYTQLNKTSSQNLKSLLVELLYYGEEYQKYRGYNTENLVTSDLTDEQKKLHTTDTLDYSNVANSKYQLNPNGTAKNEVNFKSASMLLEGKVIPRIKAEISSSTSINDYTFRWTVDGKNTEFTYAEHPDWFTQTNGSASDKRAYYVDCTVLKADQFSTPFYLTVFKNGTQVSNMLQYSVESYATGSTVKNNVKLKSLVDQMLRYGRAEKIRLGK